MLGNSKLDPGCNGRGLMDAGRFYVCSAESEGMDQWIPCHPDLLIMHHAFMQAWGLELWGRANFASFNVVFGLRTGASLNCN